MASLRNGEFFHLYQYRLGMVLGQNEISQIRGELLDQFPISTVSELENVIRNLLVIDSLFDAVARRGRGKIECHIDCYEQPLRFGSFLVRNSDATKHFQ